MEAYIEKLDQLIALKKSKGHKITKKEREEFVSAWSELVEADGCYSERAEQYFYEGFVFAGAKPFVKWVLSSEDRIGALDSLFKGHVFGKDASSSFRVLISALAQLIKEEPDDKKLVCPLIKQIPFFSKNKENKPIGDGHNIIFKYFISEIDDTSALPVLSELDLKPVVLTSFIAVFDEYLSRLNSSPKKAVQTLALVKRWLHPDIVEGNFTKKNSELEQEEHNNNKVVPASSDQRDQSCPRPNGTPYNRLVSILNEAISLSNNLSNELKSMDGRNVALQETISRLQREVETLKSQLKDSSQREFDLEKQLADQTSEILRLNLRNKSLEETTQKMSSDIDKMKIEIDQRTQMIDALRLDRAKQSDEQLHRLASKLKIEYRDFRDAENLTMNCDLGENMREQLKNVFSILSEEGITLG